MFNKDVQKAFDASNPNLALNGVLDRMKDSLSRLAGLVSGNLLMYQTMCIEALLTINVHNRDIISNMIGSRVSTREDFEWTKYVWLFITVLFPALVCLAENYYMYMYYTCQTN